MSDKNEKNSRPVGGGLFFYVLMIVILIVFSTIMFGGNYGQKDKHTLSDIRAIIDDESNEVSLVEIIIEWYTRYRQVVTSLEVG